MSEQPDSGDLYVLTTKIVASHVTYNAVVVGDLSKLIQQVFNALSTVASGAAAPERRQPAVPIKRSVTPDYIVCLDDGKKLKMLKRHLKTSYGLTPDEYRKRWGLPGDYPMVAPNYAAQRSALAKKIGLGTKTRKRRRRRTGREENGV